MRKGIKNHYVYCPTKTKTKERYFIVWCREEDHMCGWFTQHKKFTLCKLICFFVLTQYWVMQHCKNLSLVGHCFAFIGIVHFSFSREPSKRYWKWYQFQVWAKNNLHIIGCKEKCISLKMAFKLQITWILYQPICY